MKEEMKLTTGITTKALGEKYLGLPTAVGHSTTEAFEPIPAKIRGLVGGWSEKCLSSAAKEVLIKSVAQAVATYLMSCFILSAKTRKKITSTISNYWWGGAAGSRAIHWRRWQKLTMLNCHGGMGFQDVKQFNVALLGKAGVL
jgi:hypothetical protein